MTASFRVLELPIRVFVNVNAFKILKVDVINVRVVVGAAFVKDGGFGGSIV